MIIEGRTINTIEEMLELCHAAVAATHADPSTIRLHVAQDMRVAEIIRADGRKLHPTALRVLIVVIGIIAIVTMVF